MKIGSCSLCGEELYETDQHTYHRQLVGWERVYKGRGKPLKVRRETGAVAHGKCVEEHDRKQRLGVPVKQTGLF